MYELIEKKSILWTIHPLPKGRGFLAAEVKKEKYKLRKFYLFLALIEIIIVFVLFYQEFTQGLTLEFTKLIAVLQFVYLLIILFVLTLHKKIKLLKKYFSYNKVKE